MVTERLWNGPAAVIGVGLAATSGHVPGVLSPGGPQPNGPQLDGSMPPCPRPHGVLQATLPGACVPLPRSWAPQSPVARVTHSELHERPVRGGEEVLKRSTAPRHQVPAEQIAGKP